MAQDKGRSDDGLAFAEIRAAAVEQDLERNEERGHAIIDYLLENAPDDLVGGL
jgi:hypothetical protein